MGGNDAVESSRDGRTIVGTGIDARNVKQAAIWLRAAEWRLLEFSLGFGGGVKYFLSRSFDVRGHVRSKPNVLDDSSGDVCVPFGFCQGTLQQVEFAAGAVLRF